MPLPAEKIALYVAYCAANGVTAIPTFHDSNGTILGSYKQTHYISWPSPIGDGTSMDQALSLINPDSSGLTFAAGIPCVYYGVVPSSGHIPITWDQFMAPAAAAKITTVVGPEIPGFPGEFTNNLADFAEGAVVSEGGKMYRYVKRIAGDAYPTAFGGHWEVI